MNTSVNIFSLFNTHSPMANYVTNISSWKKYFSKLKKLLCIFFSLFSFQHLYVYWLILVYLQNETMRIILRTTFTQAHNDILLNNFLWKILMVSECFPRILGSMWTDLHTSNSRRKKKEFNLKMCFHNAKIRYFNAFHVQYVG